MTAASLLTSTLALAIDGASPCLALAGTRLWAVIGAGDNLLTSNDGVWLWYSDPDGAGNYSTWQQHAQADSSTTRKGSLTTYQDDKGVWHLHVLTTAATKSTVSNLVHRAMHSGVAGGNPGSLSTAFNLDTGTCQASVFVTNTTANPRIWVLYRKASGSNFQINLRYCQTGATADTFSNWKSSDDVGARSSTNEVKFGVGVWWKVAGVDRATIVVTDPASIGFLSFTFDPTFDYTNLVNLGSSTGFGTAASFDAMQDQGMLFAIGAQNDYLVFGRRDATAGNWGWFKSVDGTWPTSPWGSKAMGRASITSDGTHFWIVSTNTYYAIASGSASAMSYWLITPALGDDFSVATTFSSGNSANALCAVCIAGRLRALYRGSTASPYNLTFDWNTVSLVPLTLSTGAVAAPQRYDEAVLGMSPVAYYPMSDTTGTAMTDASGNGHGGTYKPAGVGVIGGPTMTAGAIASTGETAIAFDAAQSQYAEVGDNAVLSVDKTRGFTFVFWMRPDAIKFSGAGGQVVRHLSGSALRIFASPSTNTVPLDDATGIVYDSPSKVQVGVFDTTGAFRILTIGGVNGPPTNTLTGCTSPVQFDIPAGAEIVQGENYIYAFAKGKPGQAEYALRFYSSTDVSPNGPRTNRISAYTFDLSGLGTGAYVQEAPNVVEGQYVCVGATFDPFSLWPDPPNPSFRRQGVNIFKNGFLIRGTQVSANALESYWGADSQTINTTLKPGVSIVFPLTSGTDDIPLSTVSTGLANLNPKEVVIIDNGGTAHTVTYTGITIDPIDSKDILTDCISDSLLGTANASNLVVKGQWMIAPGHATDPLWLATRQDISPFYFKGALDEVAVFQRTLSNAELYALAKLGPVRVF